MLTHRLRGTHQIEPVARGQHLLIGNILYINSPFLSAEEENKVDPMSFVMPVVPFYFVLTARVLFPTSWIHRMLLFRWVMLMTFSNHLLVVPGLAVLTFKDHSLPRFSCRRQTGCSQQCRRRSLRLPRSMSAETISSAD